MTWDEMMPVDGHQCNSRHSGKNQFQGEPKRPVTENSTLSAALLWEGDSTVLFTNYEDIQMPFDCVSKRYAMVRVKLDGNFECQICDFIIIDVSCVWT